MTRIRIDSNVYRGVIVTHADVYGPDHDCPTCQPPRCHRGGWRTGVLLAFICIGLLFALALS